MKRVLLGLLLFIFSTVWGQKYSVQFKGKVHTVRTNATCYKHWFRIYLNFHDEQYLAVDLTFGRGHENETFNIDKILTFDKKKLDKFCPFL